jgi:hypothetical protein
VFDFISNYRWYYCTGIPDDLNASSTWRRQYRCFETNAETVVESWIKKQWNHNKINSIMVRWQRDIGGAMVVSREKKKKNRVPMDDYSDSHCRSYENFKLMMSMQCFPSCWVKCRRVRNKYPERRWDINLNNCASESGVLERVIWFLMRFSAAASTECLWSS